MSNCATPNQYIVTVPATGLYTPLRYRRNESYDADNTLSAGKNRLILTIPSVDADGNDVDTDGVAHLVYQEESTTPALSDELSVLAEVFVGGQANIHLPGSFVKGYFYIRSPREIEFDVHVMEVV